ncbi:type I polyketide synthase [Streptomyces sparsogenes]|uniref:Polyketide synthase module (OzmQ) n=1 Tax=Streptomyces sparsogenes DSM 40356 TaxID=1331668 RepID=A0A1R1SEY1_9ACTN|nr:beta-ketoacyl synthase N-terminal-like domain-containing protein [Streptomyces sparsogenes]OMI36738.1 polyketide synthase module (OzmQ) [Streptomyces sparsogenes DSM 40356]
MDQHDIRETDIAIVGMACRLPGAPSVEAFWRNLREGVESTTFLSDEELLAAGVDPQLINDPNYVKAAQLLPDIDTFDADLFRVTADEAEILDPQQRQFLECALEALEDAGYDPGAYDGTIGVYAGAGLNTYLLNNLHDRYRDASTLDDYRLMLANDKDFLATRVSYKLDLRGPSLSINTACSTSLVAVHTACLSLISGDCDAALAGAVHIKVPQRKGYRYQEGMILSPDGHCRAFDAKAQGTIVGDGVGVVVLKRLRDALDDGDFIHAVIKGTAVNNDGAAKAGYTAPTVEGQAAVIRDAQEIADCPPHTIGYVEAHGTGTPLGDPIEVTALNTVFTEDTEGVGRCAIGSVKTNIGHLDVAAGMAGLIKTSLMLRHAELVPSLNFESPNPDIDFDAGPFHVATELSDWPATDGAPRRAGVSAFGIGGTNAHVVLEAPPARPAPSEPRPAELLVLSARSPQALQRAMADLARHLRKHPELSPADVAKTLGVGRRAHRHRCAVVCSDLREAALALALADREQLITGELVGDRPDVVYGVADRLGDGGAHAVALLRELPAYRTEIQAVTGTDGTAAEALLGSDDAAAALVAQLAAARLFTAWGVRPAAVTGGPVARLVAACLAGELTVPEALRLVEEDPATWTGVPPTPSDTPTGALLLRLQPDGTASLGLHRTAHDLATVWTAGADVDWEAFYDGEQRCRVPLPHYPFERTRHWIEPEHRAARRTPAPDALPERLAAAVGHERVDIITEFVQRKIATVLGGEAGGLPETDRNLFDMGLDSLILIDVTAHLGDALGEQVDASAFVEYPTIRSFSEHLAIVLGLVEESPAQQDTTRTSRRAQRAAARRTGQA